MILITGGMGFIGLHTAHRFLDAGEDVVLTQYRARREPDFIKDELGRRAHVEALDVTDGAAVRGVIKRHGVTSIVHLAVPGLGALGPADDYRVNMFGLLNVLEAAQEAGVRRVSLASSVAVYSGVPGGPFREDAPLPIPSGNPTEAFKKSFEILGLHYADRAGMDVAALRIGGIYGPLYHSMSNLPSRMAHAAVKGVPADYTGARGGTPYADDAADLCYVKDCAAGIVLVHMAETLPRRTYNIGGGRATSNGELAAAVRKVVPDAQIELREGAGPQARTDAYMDLASIRADLGYEPSYTIDSAIADYIAWLRSNPQ
jgi:UDP-glucose 4-epimerase